MFVKIRIYIAARKIVHYDRFSLGCVSIRDVREDAYRGMCLLIMKQNNSFTNLASLNASDYIRS